MEFYWNQSWKYFFYILWVVIVWRNLKLDFWVVRIIDQKFELYWGPSDMWESSMLRVVYLIQKKSSTWITLKTLWSKNEEWNSSLGWDWSYQICEIFSSKARKELKVIPKALERILVLEIFYVGWMNSNWVRNHLMG